MRKQLLISHAVKCVLLRYVSLLDLFFKLLAKLIMDHNDIVVVWPFNGAVELIVRFLRVLLIVCFVALFFDGILVILIRN